VSTLRTTEPSIRSRWLGRRLRELREDRGFTLRHAERTVGLRFAEIKAAELGVHLLQLSQIAALLELYGVYVQEERDLLLELARDVRHLDRWEDHIDAPPLSPTMLDFLWLESRARTIRCYSPTLVPDLLQIPDYAEAVARQNSNTAAFPREAVWWGRACKERQQILDGAPPGTLHAVIAEVALYRPPGRSPGVLVRQLHHLAHSTLLHVSIQVLPSTAPYLPGMGGSITVFDLVQPRGLIAAVHSLNDPVIYQEWHAAQHGQALERLSRAALTPEASAQLIAEVAERLSKEEEKKCHRSESSSCGRYGRRR
jgi:transcriptional regulator with XRE-family HTH domain